MLWSLSCLVAVAAAMPAQASVAGRDDTAIHLQPRDQPESTVLACRLFNQIFPSQTFFSNNSSSFAAQNEDYYTSAAWLGPACIVQPSTVAEMSYVIKAVSLLGATFAVRGGGHMPIADAANIDSNGVLISTSGLTTLELSADNAFLTIGAGNRWIDVQQYLQPHGLAAVGGRVGHVGVSGFTLGGGISFYGNQYGFASSNVFSYECVLAGGEVVIANETSNPDLFWALKGGGNSFAIVTKFTMRVYESPSVWVGNTVYNSSSKDAWLEAVYKFGLQTDAKAAAIPLIMAAPNANDATYVLTRFYDGINAGNASVWNDFTAPNLTPLADTYSSRSLVDYFKLEVDPPVAAAHGKRQKFHVVSSTVSRDALKIVHDSFFSHISQAWSTIPGLTAAIAIQPITKHFIQKSGDIPQGIDASTGPYFWHCITFTWTSQSSDSEVDSLIASLDTIINQKLSENSLRGSYLYLNDASENQPVFESYPADNLARLKQIREKYDPHAILTNQMPGGWKVANV